MDLRSLHQGLKPTPAQLEAILERAPVGIAVVQLSPPAPMIVISANQTFRRLLASCPDSVDLINLLSPQSYEELVRVIEADGGVCRLQTASIDDVAKPVACDADVARLDDSSRFLIIAHQPVCASVPEKEAEAAEMAAVKQREDFIATLTHDLKTPIVGANMVLAAFLDGTLGVLSDQQAEIIAKLSLSNQALLTMINHLLDIYKYESGSQSLTRCQVDLIALAKSCSEEMKPILDNKLQKLHQIFPAGQIELLCDQYAIQRVVTNLLGNAVKFTPEGGLIMLSVEEDSRYVVLKVIDTGSGIDEKDQPRLFQRFWQGDPGRRYAAGTGLGLYFCSNVVRAHDGTIECSSSSGAGSTFTIKLPKSPV